MATLAYCGHVKRKAAEILGVSLKTLYNRLETYNGRDSAGGKTRLRRTSPSDERAVVRFRHSAALRLRVATTDSHMPLRRAAPVAVFRNGAVRLGHAASSAHKSACRPYESQS